MTDSTTSTLGLTLPGIFPGDVWGAKLNANFQAVDAFATTRNAEAAKRFESVSSLLADTSLTYTTGSVSTVAAGAVIETRSEGFAYQVAASGASDHHVTTAGGVKLYVLPPYNIKAFGAVGDGVTDDRPAFVVANTVGGHLYLPKPAVAYNVSSPINLDRAGITVDPTASWEALTDSGNITWNTNPTGQDDPPAPVHRFNGRVFLGDAAHEMAGRWTPGVDGNDAGALSWYADQTPIFGGYVSRDATLVVNSGIGRVGMAVSTRTSDNPSTAFSSIGFASFVHNNTALRNCWGGIIEGRMSSTGGLTIGLEFALGNISGVTSKSKPYAIFDGGGVMGLWLAGGGDASFGTPSNAPNNAAVSILKSATNTGLDGGWTSGIVIASDGINGTDGSAGSTTYGTAIAMGRMHRIEWHEPTNSGLGFSITSRVSAASGAWRMEATNLKLEFRRPDNTVFGEWRDNGASGVDYPVMQNGTGLVSMFAEGASADIDVRLVPKGSGRVRFGTRVASGDVPVTGYIEILDAGGVVRRLAVVG